LATDAQESRQRPESEFCKHEQEALSGPSDGLWEDHGLRHTCATPMLKGGVNVKVVSERSGHAEVAHTLNVYSHVLPGMQQEDARKIDELLA
jgi:integrase